jgi:sugar O-acyltransferase (sialic acid O-acetyltransferase NeuD family)
MQNIIVIGSGGHGRSVAESILQSGEFNLVGFVDDSFTPNATLWGYPILGKINDLAEVRLLADFAVVAIGNNTFREKIFTQLNELNFKLASIFHPKSIVSPRAIIGEGTVVMAGGIVGTEAKLGRGVIINCGATVDHHCIVEDFGHLGVNACMAGGSSIGALAWLQAGSSLGYGVSVLAKTIILPGVGVN